MFSEVAGKFNLGTEVSATRFTLRVGGWLERRAGCSCFLCCSFAFSGRFTALFSWLCPFVYQAVPCRSVWGKGLPSLGENFQALYCRLKIVFEAKLGASDLAPSFYKFSIEEELNWHGREPLCREFVAAIWCSTADEGRLYGSGLFFPYSSLIRFPYQLMGLFFPCVSTVNNPYFTSI